MQHTCQDCDHQFTVDGQNEPHITPAAQCPQCHSYRTQPSGQPDEQNDMLHVDMGMPTSTQDDMSGNPLQEGSLGGWKDRSVRDESFGGGTYSYKLSLFETPEFETTEIVAPPDLYRHGMESEASHQSTVQIPKGITDNLHAALGNLGAWVENPYENGELRPYYNKYWKVIRPAFMEPNSLRIGVADPHMTDILNHVAETDDLTPLYEYRGQKTTKTKTAAALPALAEGLAGAADAGAGVAADTGAGGIGGIMQKVFRSPTALLGLGDDLIGGLSDPGKLPQQQVNPTSFYASAEDDAFPASHDEIPKNEDGDSNQKDDGDNQHWQKDYSVNGGGGTDHSPSFDPAGIGFQRFINAIPLLLQYLTTGEDGSQDPIIKGVHEALEGEIPGYLNHADDGAAQRLVMILSPNGQASEQGKDKAAEPEKNEPDHTDENSGGAKESRVASLHGEAAEFLPSFEVELPALNPPLFKKADTQGPQTPEQIQAVQKWLMEHGPEMGLEGDELIQTMLSVPTNPLEFADVLANIQQSESPPAPPQDAGLNDGPPAPAQEQAPPQATMPMPGMSAPMGAMSKMQAAVEKYAADSVAGKCPECGSHTTELIDDEGNSHCHACHHIFKTEGIKADKINSVSSSASTHWNVDQDFRKEADIDTATDSVGVDTEPVQGVPIADQQHQRDIREEQDSGHTWTDEDGNPLKVGQEYEMYSNKYDIPDIVRIEAVKPSSIIYTLTGEYGLNHSTELTKEEADLEGDTFVSTMSDSDYGPEDDSLEHNNDDNSGYTGPGQDDASHKPNAPVSLMSSTASENPSLDWLKEGMQVTAGANYTPMEQRTLIEESGVARNSDMLDLVGTHYITDANDDQFAFGW